MAKLNSSSATILGVAIAAGMIIAAFTLSRAIYEARASERFVTVKGLAEREVQADLAIWPITFKDAGNDLSDLHNSMNRKREIITGFLLEQGFEEQEISLAPPKIRDARAEYYGGQPQAGYRYQVQTTVTLRTSKVELVKESMEKSNELVGQGIVLAETWESRTEFLFTSLNDIKPGMIREATLNAREAAEKFAGDSGSKVGKIRKATQGLFSISDRDQNSPEIKIVRVVTTMEYFLTDK